MMTIKMKDDCSDDDDDDEGKKGRDDKGSEEAPPTLPCSDSDPLQSLSSNGAQLKEQQHPNAPEQPTASVVSELTVRLVDINAVRQLAHVVRKYKQTAFRPLLCARTRD